MIKTKQNTSEGLSIDGVAYIVLAIIISGLISVIPEPGDNVARTFMQNVMLRTIIILIVIVFIEFVKTWRRTK